MNYHNILLLTLFITCACNAGAQKHDRQDLEANVGRFPIHLRDDRLNKGKENRSLLSDLSDLYDRTWDYYISYPVADDGPFPTTADKDANLTKLANESLKNQDKSDWWTPFMSAFAHERLAEYRKSNPAANDTDYYIDLTSFYLDAIYYVWNLTDYWSFGSLMGVGMNVPCSDHVNNIIAVKDDWEKAGSQAASTIMALMPTFLAFGNLYVPRSSEVFATSALVGLTTSIYSLGLPVQSLSTIKGSRVLDLATFGLAALAAIAAFGTGPIKPASQDEEEDRLKDLRSWTDGTMKDEAKDRFAVISRQVGRWQQRWHFWGVPALLVASAQVVMFVLAVAPLLTNPGAPLFLLACENNWTGRYLSVSAAANAVVRIFFWEIGDHERVKVYDLSPRALSELRNTIKQSPTPLISTATEYPPLYMPFFSIFQNFFYSLRTAVPFFKNPKPLYQDPHTQGLSHSDPKRAIRHTITTRLASVRYFTKYPIQVITSGFVRSRLDARRYRPLIILIHLSTAGRNVLKTLFTGFIEASLLLMLTFFFAAQWGGNLILTLIAMALLLIFITAGRVLGFIYVYLSAKVWGLHVVNCDEKEEIRGVLRILCSMTGVLVEVNGASYCDGYRLDCIPGFDGWQRRYESGEFDEKDPLPGVDSQTHLNPDAGVAKPFLYDNLKTCSTSGEQIPLRKVGREVKLPESDAPPTASVQAIHRRPVFAREPSMAVSDAETATAGRVPGDMV